MEPELTPRGNPVGPRARHLIMALRLSQYDDWAGDVMEVVDEAAAAARKIDVEKLQATIMRLGVVIDMPRGFPFARNGAEAVETLLAMMDAERGNLGKEVGSA